ncbi:sigma-70 family RNA polymerase sigma factor, partial [Pseudonocardia pini]|uniref:sigma-70 family RNA polymerase sigma factor n=1 Tax=Pseudonocardia pini TaxID=2758030 RepID=UPI0015F05A52
MTRLIPGHDAPDVASSQVTGRAATAVTALAGALARALEGPAGTPVPERRVSLRAVPAGEGVTLDGTEEGDLDRPATPVGPNLGTVTQVRETGTVVPVSWGDTPGAALVRPIGKASSSNGRATVPEPDSAGSGLTVRPAIRAVPDPVVTDVHGADHLTPLPEAADAGDVGPAAAADIASGLWTDYLGTRSVSARDRLVVHYRALVRGVAGKLASGLPTHVDAADLVQVGMFGLIDAVERFDPEREVRFESYAAQRIRGAMLDELRAQDWVPRGYEPVRIETPEG